MKAIHDTYTIPKSGHYVIGSRTQVFEGSKNPVEFSLPEGFVLRWDYESDDSSCKHNWKNYLGFTESFKYCTKCDEKRDVYE